MYIRTAAWYSFLKISVKTFRIKSHFQAQWIMKLYRMILKRHTLKQGTPRFFLQHLNQHLCYNRDAKFVACVPHEYSVICGLCCAQCVRTRNNAPYCRDKKNTPKKCVSLFASRKVHVSGNTVYKMFDLFLKEASTYRETVYRFLFAVHF
jgi:hypothetical protein